MKRTAATIVREYGPFPGVAHVAGVSYDGRHVWFASGDKLNALDPDTGEKVRAIDVAAHAGTAFDGHYLFQLSGHRIQKIDPTTGRVLTTIPAPGGGGSGLAWTATCIDGCDLNDLASLHGTHAYIILLCNWRPTNAAESRRIFESIRRSFRFTR